MKALVKKKAEEGLWLEEVAKPEVAPHHVLVKVDRAGICGTDLHIYKWDDWASKTVPVPLVVGHEFVGEIVEVGSEVTDFKPGEWVSGEGHVVCGRCRNCMAGRRHLCSDTAGIGVTRPVPSPNTSPCPRPAFGPTNRESISTSRPFSIPLATPLTPR